MAFHKVKVGQLVDYASARPGMPTSGRQYEVLRLLPAEAGQFLYRVKSKGEAFERVAKEGSFRTTFRPTHRKPTEPMGAIIDVPYLR